VGTACLALLVAPRLPGSIGIRATAAEVAFVALVVQALPFLLAGAGVAALLHGPGGRRLMASAARHPRLAAALTPLSGVALPLCDCGLVPLARCLAQRGARGAVVNGFVAGAPLTNPIVILSTLVAFPGQPMMAVGRVGVGLAVAMVVAALAPPPVSWTTPQGAGSSPAPRIGMLQALGTELGRTAPVLVLGALAAGVVAGRLTRGAKAAQDGFGSDASARRSNIGYDAGLPASPYDSPRTADLASSGEPWSTGAATPSSGPVYDTSTQGHGTATGEPLAGTGTPASRPVYPGGAEDGRA
jgi:hypothetical protein